MRNMSSTLSVISATHKSFHDGSWPQVSSAMTPSVKGA
jgi:hypothetical protein